MKDPMNLTDTGYPLTNLKDVDGTQDNIDFIKLKIVVPTVYDGGISFRAFIKDFKHNAKGEYEEQRYVGRPERFIVYKGLNRSVTFELYLAAFGKAELDGVWARANMLNKLVYPINNMGGYMVPPIIRMTLGGILEDQPGYITDISMDLAESPWDITSELTHVVHLSITFNIIEKNYISQSNSDGLSTLFASSLLNTDTDIANTVNAITRATSTDAFRTALSNINIDTTITNEVNAPSNTGTANLIGLMNSVNNTRIP